MTHKGKSERTENCSPHIINPKKARKVFFLHYINFRFYNQYPDSGKKVEKLKACKEFLFHCHRGAMKRNGSRRQVASALHNFRTITIFPNIWVANRQKYCPPLSSSSPSTSILQKLGTVPDEPKLMVKVSEYKDSRNQH